MLQVALRPHAEPEAPIRSAASIHWSMAADRGLAKNSAWIGASVIYSFVMPSSSARLRATHLAT